MAILGAMISNLPVIISHQCNFPEMAEYGADIVIEPDYEQLAKALSKLLDDFTLCEKMGRNGHKLILKKYTWNKITDQMIKLYEDVLLRKKVNVDETTYSEL